MQECNVLAMYGLPERQSLQGSSDRTGRGIYAWQAKSQPNSRDGGNNRGQDSLPGEE